MHVPVFYFVYHYGTLNDAGQQQKQQPESPQGQVQPVEPAKQQMAST